MALDILWGIHMEVSSRQLDMQVWMISLGRCAFGGVFSIQGVPTVKRLGNITDRGDIGYFLDDCYSLTPSASVIMPISISTARRSSFSIQGPCKSIIQMMELHCVSLFSGFLLLLDWSPNSSAEALVGPHTSIIRMPFFSPVLCRLVSTGLCYLFPRLMDLSHFPASVLAAPPAGRGNLIFPGSLFSFKFQLQGPHSTEFLPKYSLWAIWSLVIIAGHS